MDAPERVFPALAHKQPDRVPIDCWSTDAVTRELLRHYGLSTREELPRRLDVDFRHIEGPTYVGPELTVDEEGNAIDLSPPERLRPSCESKTYIDLPLGPEQAIYEA